MQGIAESSIGTTKDSSKDNEDFEVESQRTTELELKLRQEDELLDGVELAALQDEKNHHAREVVKERERDTPWNTLLATVGWTGEKGSLRKKPEDDQDKIWKFVKSRMPVFTWAKLINRETLKTDIIAGLTVGVMVIPQGMSYASIAGLRYEYGLYSACIPTFIYAFFGQSRQLAVGPVAMVSLLVEAGLKGALRNAPESEGGCDIWYEKYPTQEAQSANDQYSECPVAYAQMAFLCSFMVGILQIGASILQLGFIVSFLGHPVVSGFTSGAAIIIGMSQVKYIFGLKKVAKSQVIYETLWNIFSRYDEFNWIEFLFGFCWIAYLMLNRKLAQKIKHPVLKMIGPLGPLISCVVGILIISAVGSLKTEHNVSVVGDIPPGLDGVVSIQNLRFQDVAAVFPTAVIATVIGYMESIAIGKNLAAKHNYEIEAGQELLALGCSNFVGAMFSCYPVTGSFSRSAVNNTTGAKTQLSGLITSLLILLTLLFLTPLFYNLPKFVLAAIVISSVVSLVATSEAKRLFKVKKNDFLCWMVAFLGTLFLGVLPGILTAVGLSLLIVIAESVRPQIQILWRIPGTTIYRSVNQETDGSFIPGVLIARIGSSLYFANAAYVKDMILGYLSDLDEVNRIEYVILEMTPVVSLDSTAMHMFHDLAHDFHSRNLNLAFCMVGNRVMKTMQLGGLKEQIGRQWFFKNVDEAVQYCVKHQHVVRHRSERLERGIDMCEVGSMKDLAVSTEAKVRRGNEIGFSNDLRDNQTVVYINLFQDLPGAVNRFSEVFTRNKVSIIRANIEPTQEGGFKHTYNVISEKSQGQLKDWEIGLVKESMMKLWGDKRKAEKGVCVDNSDADDHNFMAGNNRGELEELVKAQDKKIDVLMAMMQTMQQGQGSKLQKNWDVLTV